MKRLLIRRCTRERGATAVEYALVVGLVSLLVIAGPLALSDSFQTYCADVVEAVAGKLGV